MICNTPFVELSPKNICLSRWICPLRERTVEILILEFSNFLLKKISRQKCVEKTSNV